MSYTEEELLVRIADGNEKAFQQFFDRYWNTIYSTALAYIQSPTLAEDVTQDIFLKCWKSRASLIHVQSLSNWLFIITRNHVFRMLRDRRRPSPLDEWMEDTLAETHTHPETQLHIKELQELIAAAVKVLPAQQKYAWQLSREQGLNHDQVAATMQISKNTVRNHIVKALSHIRHYIESHDIILLVLLTGWLFLHP